MGQYYKAYVRNDEGENVVIGRSEGCVYTETFQSNGWVRTNYYYEDGTVEELFGK